MVTSSFVLSVIDRAVLIEVLDIHRQPILADEIQTFKALICVHKVLQEGAPITLKEAQQHAQWIESLTRGVSGEGLRGTEQDPTPHRSGRQPANHRLDGQAMVH